MIIDKNTVEKIADLSRIGIKEENVETLTGELNKILTFMEKLNELDTTGVAPLVYMNEAPNTWRTDVIKDELPTHEGLKNAPLHNEQYFLVPKVIEK